MKKYKEQLHNNIDGGLAHNMNSQDIADKHKVDISVILTQLEKGIEVEYEHTYSTEIAKEIAMDHLVEYPYYYDELEKIEKKFENIKGNKMERYKRKFNEGCKKGKGGKKKDLKENIVISNKDKAFEAISEGVRFIAKTNNISLFRGYIVNAIIDGFKIDYNDDEKSEIMFNRKLKMLINELKRQYF